MENIENNKIIAEFMGGLKDGESRLSLQKNEIWLPIHGVCHLGNSGKVLKYHSSWDWLMEVVEKIEGVLPDDSVITIQYKDCNIPVNEGEFDIYINATTKIEAVYNACLEFIKWYNQQKE